MRFDFIQILRAFAANAVVLSHIEAVEQTFTSGHGLLPTWLPLIGDLGVDLFFIISGFVIIKTAKRENWREFIFARVTRIYPPYWIYTSIFAAIYFAGPAGMSDHSSVSLIGSYLLWPTNGGTLLPVGWTLIHEMYFYSVMTLTLVLRTRIAWVLLIWAAFIAFGVYFAHPTSQIGSVVLNPLTFLFILGGFVGLIEISAVRDKPRAPIGRLAVLLGDASYSTYLAHLFVVSAIWRAAYFFPVHLPSLVLILLSLVAANAVGVGSFWWIERPMLRLAKRQKARMQGMATPI